jgi:hypothetical protein
VPTIVEVIILGLFSGLRPGTSTVAVLALLKGHKPARALLFFTVAGFVFIWVIGVLVVLAFHGADRATGGTTLSSVLNIALGAAAVGFAAGIHRGWVNPTFRRSPGARSNSRTARLTARLSNPSPGIAAATGALTHLPGIVYVLALNAIATQEPPVTGAGLEVALYAVLWLLVPLASLILVIVRPGAGVVYLERATAWARCHEQVVLVVGSLVVGVYFVVKGTVGLIS